MAEAELWKTQSKHAQSQCRWPVLSAFPTILEADAHNHSSLGSAFLAVKDRLCTLILDAGEMVNFSN